MPKSSNKRKSYRLRRHEYLSMLYFSSQ